jgi:hypothetical protein
MGRLGSIVSSHEPQCWVVTNATTGWDMNEAVCLVCNVSLFHFQPLILILPVDKLELLLAFVVDTSQVLWHSHVSAT